MCVVCSSFLPKWRKPVERSRNRDIVSSLCPQQFLLESFLAGTETGRELLEVQIFFSWLSRLCPQAIHRKHLEVEIFSSWLSRLCPQAIHLPGPEVFNEADLDQRRSVLRLFSKIAEWLGNVPALGKELNISSDFIFLYSNFYVMCVRILPAYMSEDHLLTRCQWRSEDRVGSPELELETVVRSHVGTGNPTQVLWKST